MFIRIVMNIYWHIGKLLYDFPFFWIYMDLLKPRSSKYPKTKCLKYCDRGTSTIFFSGYSWKGLGIFFFTKGEDIISSNIAMAAWHQAERWPEAGDG